LLAQDSSDPPVEYPLAADRLQWHATKPNVVTVENGALVAVAPGEDAQVVGRYRRTNGEVLTVQFRIPRVWPAVDRIDPLPQRDIRCELGDLVDLSVQGMHQGRPVEIDTSRIKWLLDSSPVGFLNGSQFVARNLGTVVVTADLPTGATSLLTTFRITVVDAVAATPVGSSGAGSGTPSDRVTTGDANGPRGGSTAAGSRAVDLDSVPPVGSSEADVIQQLGEPVLRPEPGIDPLTLEVLQVLGYRTPDGKLLIIRFRDGRLADKVVK
jgi:hypothetical protein